MEVMIKGAEVVLFHSNRNRTEADFHKRGRLSPGPASQGWDSGTEPGVYFLFSVLTSLLFSFILSSISSSSSKSGEKNQSFVSGLVSWRSRGMTLWGNHEVKCLYKMGI